MDNINVQESNVSIADLIDTVNRSQQATLITADADKRAVLVPLEEWNSLQETLYLSSIPGVKADLIEGKNTPWENCTPLEEVEW